MVEKYEAIGYLKINQEKEGNQEIEKEQKATLKLLSLLGRALFEVTLEDLYDKGMKAGYADEDFMIKLTDLFVSSTSSFYCYTSEPSEEEAIKSATLFLDAIKHDTVECIKHAYNMRKNFNI